MHSLVTSCEQHKLIAFNTLDLSLDGLCMLLPALTGLCSAITSVLPSLAEPCRALPSLAEPSDDLVIIGVITARRLLNCLVSTVIAHSAFPDSDHRVHNRLSAVALAGVKMHSGMFPYRLLRQDRRELCRRGGCICSLV